MDLDTEALILIGALLSFRDLCWFAAAAPACRDAARAVRPRKLVVDSKAVGWFRGEKTGLPSLSKLAEIHLTSCARAVPIMPFAQWLGTAELPCLRALVVARDLWGVSIQAFCLADSLPALTSAAFLQDLPLQHTLNLLPTGLTRLDFDGVYEGELDTACLSRFPQLADLNLAANNAAIGLFPPLPRLTSLTFYFLHGFTTKQLLQEGTFPLLEDLIIYLSQPGPVSLRTTFGLTKESFRALLESMPRLSRLRISVKGGRHGGGLIEGLSYPAQMPPLRNVEIKGHWADPQAVTFPFPGYHFERASQSPSCLYYRAA